MGIEQRDGHLTDSESTDGMWLRAMMATRETQPLDSQLFDQGTC